MRFYEITIGATPGTTIPANPATGVIGGTTSGQVQRQWTTMPGGIYDPNALQVEFDFFSSTTYQGGQSPVATLQIEGIALNDLFQSQKFYNRSIVIKAGMTAGLPLANPAQAGVIWNGTINQSFGNWVGNDQSLGFVMYPANNYTFQKPGNFVLNWLAGTSLQAALTTCLNVAYPTLPTPTFAIGSQYVLGYNVLHAVSTFPLLAQYVNSITNSITPPGVFMALRPDNTIYVWDGSTPSTTIQVAFNDLVGQPAWIGANLMQFATAMRADIQVGATIQMPQGIAGPGGVSLTPESFPSQLGSQYTTDFQGKFSVQSVRFIGNFRGTGPQDWITLFKAVPVSM